MVAQRGARVVQEESADLRRQQPAPLGIDVRESEFRARCDQMGDALALPKPPALDSNRATQRDGRHKVRHRGRRSIHRGVQHAHRKSGGVAS